MRAETGRLDSSMLFCRASTMIAHSPNCRWRTSKLALADPNASVIQPRGFIRLAAVDRDTQFKTFSPQQNHC